MNALYSYFFVSANRYTNSRFRNLLAFCCVAPVLAFAVYACVHSVIHWNDAEVNAIAEMEANHGVCQSLGCWTAAHEYNVETPQQKLWYHDHITLYQEARAREDARIHAQICKQLGHEANCTY